jgi:hypothetical protein
MVIDDPAALAEVTAAFDRYEAALEANDLEALDDFFWRSELALRFGVGEALYGFDAIAAFRKTRTGGSPPRRILRRAITTFGRDFATANIEFQRLAGGPIGRQSQVWVRLDGGWRVVAGHISLQGSSS